MSAELPPGFQLIDAPAPELPEGFELLPPPPQLMLDQSTGKITVVPRPKVQKPPGPLPLVDSEPLNNALNNLAAGVADISMAQPVHAENALRHIQKGATMEPREEGGNFFSGDPAERGAAVDAKIAAMAGPPVEGARGWIQQKIPRVVGNLAGLMTMGGAGAGFAPATIPAAMGLGAASDKYVAAKKAGATDEQAAKAAGFAGAINTAAGALLGPVAKVARVGAGGPLAGEIAQGAVPTLGQSAKFVALDSAGQAGIMTGAQLATNAVDQTVYDPQRHLSEGLGEAAIMGAGFGMLHAPEVVGAALRSRQLNGDTVPEKVETLKAQQAEMVDGKRDIMMFPTGAPELPVPDGFARVKTEVGVFHYDPEVIEPAEIKLAIEQDRLGDILDYGIPAKPNLEEPHTAIVRRDAEGNEIEAVVTDHEHLAPVMSKVAGRAEPGQTVGMENPAETVQRRKEDTDPESIAFAGAEAWDRAHRMHRGDEWFAGARVNPAGRAGFDEALAAGGDQVQAHGMSKEGTMSGGFRNLMGLLRGGLDEARRGGVLDTAPLVSKAGQGLVGATASGSAYSDGPFMLVQKPGTDGLNGKLENLGAVLVNETNAHLTPYIRKAIQSVRPDVMVESYAKAGDVVKALRKQEGQQGLSPEEFTRQEARRARELRAKYREELAQTLTPEREQQISEESQQARTEQELQNNIEAQVRKAEADQREATERAAKTEMLTKAPDETVADLAAKGDADALEELQARNDGNDFEVQLAVKAAKRRAKQREEAAAIQDQVNQENEDISGIADARGPEILEALAQMGGLPHSEAGPLNGELATLREGAGQKLRVLFRTKQKKSLDQLREAMAQKGFAFDTPADLLSAVDQRLRTGKPHYGSPRTATEEQGQRLAQGPFKPYDNRDERFPLPASSHGRTGAGDSGPRPQLPGRTGGVTTGTGVVPAEQVAPVIRDQVRQTLERMGLVPKIVYRSDLAAVGVANPHEMGAIHLSPAHLIATAKKRGYDRKAFQAFVDKVVSEETFHDLDHQAAWHHFRENDFDPKLSLQENSDGFWKQMPDYYGRIYRGMSEKDRANTILEYEKDSHIGLIDPLYAKGAKDRADREQLVALEYTRRLLQRELDGKTTEDVERELGQPKSWPIIRHLQALYQRIKSRMAGLGDQNNAFLQDHLKAIHQLLDKARGKGPSEQPFRPIKINRMQLPEWLTREVGESTTGGKLDEDPFAGWDEQPVDKSWHDNRVNDPDYPVEGIRQNQGPQVQGWEGHDSFPANEVDNLEKPKKGDNHANRRAEKTRRVSQDGTAMEKGPGGGGRPSAAMARENPPGRRSAMGRPDITREEHRPKSNRPNEFFDQLAERRIEEKQIEAELLQHGLKRYNPYGDWNAVGLEGNDGKGARVVYHQHIPEEWNKLPPEIRSLGDRLVELTSEHREIVEEHKPIDRTGATWLPDSYPQPFHKLRDFHVIWLKKDLPPRNPDEGTREMDVEAKGEKKSLRFSTRWDDWTDDPNYLAHANVARMKGADGQDRLVVWEAQPSYRFPKTETQKKETAEPAWEAAGMARHEVLERLAEQVKALAEKTGLKVVLGDARTVQDIYGRRGPVSKTFNTDYNSEGYVTRAFKRVFGQEGKPLMKTELPEQLWMPHHEEAERHGFTGYEFEPAPKNEPVISLKPEDADVGESLSRIDDRLNEIDARLEKKMGELQRLRDRGALRAEINTVRKYIEDLKQEKADLIADRDDLDPASRDDDTAGTPSPRRRSAPGGPADIESIHPWRLTKLFLGTKDIFLRTKGLEFLGKAIAQHVDIARKYQGEYLAPFRAWSQTHGRAAKRQAYQEFEKYWAGTDAKDPHAEAYYAKMSEPGKALVELWRAAAKATGETNQRNNVMVWDQRLADGKGAFRLSGMVRNYFPRTIRQDVWDALKAPNKYPAKFAEIMRELVAADFAKTKEEALAKLNSQFNTESTNDYFGSIESARVLKLPASLYDYSFDGARRYIMRWAERMGQIEAYGQKIGTHGKDLFDLALEKVDGARLIGKLDKQEADDTGKYINAVRDRAYGKRYDGPAWQAVSTLNALATGTQLANPVTIGVNLLSGTGYNFTFFGNRAAAAGLAELRSTKRLFDTITDAVEKGIIQDDLMHMVQDAEAIKADTGVKGKLGAAIDQTLNQTNRAAQEVARVALKYTGYNASEYFVRAHTLVTAKAFLRQALRVWEKNHKGREGMQYAAFFQRNGYNVAKLIEEAGTGEATNTFLRGAVAEVQGGYRFDQVPVWMDHPLGRFFFKYQKWGSQMARNVFLNVFEPAITGTTVRRMVDGKPTTSTVRNFKPLIQFAITAGILGWTQDQLKEWLFGRPDRTAGFDEIGKTLDHNFTQGLSLIADKYLTHIINAGALGTFGNYTQAFRDFTERSRFQNPLNPPALGVLAPSGELAMRAMEQHGLTGRDLDNWLQGEISLYRAMKQGGSRALGAVDPQFAKESTELRRQDLAWLRNITRRYADEVGLDKGNRLQFQRVGKTVDTPYREAIKQALLTGNRSEAAAELKAYLATKPEETRPAVLQSLKASVRAGRPIKVGASTSEDTQEIFLRWAQQRLSPDDLARIKDIDSDYEKTAVSLGLMTPSVPAKLRTQQDKALLEYLMKH